MKWEKLLNQWGIDTGWLKGTSPDGRMWRIGKEKSSVTIWMRHQGGRWGRINDICNIGTIDNAKHIVESAGRL